MPALARKYGAHPKTNELLAVAGDSFVSLFKYQCTLKANQINETMETNTMDAWSNRIRIYVDDSLVGN